MRPARIKILGSGAKTQKACRGFGLARQRLPRRGEGRVRPARINTRCVVGREPVEQNEEIYDPASRKLRSERGTREAAIAAAGQPPKALTGIARGKNNPNRHDHDLERGKPR